MGRFSSLQAAGLSFAPVIGGLAGALDWRIAFAATVAASVLLAFLPPADAARRSRPARWASLLNRGLALTCAVAFLSYLATSGLHLLGALRGDDDFGLGPQARGLVVATFGAAGLTSGWLLGRAVNRLGLVRFGLAATATLAAAVGLAAGAGTAGVLVLAFALGGVAGTAARTAINSMAVRTTPDNRGGAASMTLAWQFLGGAIAPLVLLPAYRVDHAMALLLAASGAAAATAVLAAAGRGVGRMSLAGPPGQALDQSRQ
jgi:predicted MFS family arabinose efflux permease